MSVNIVTGSHNTTTRIAGLASLSVQEDPEINYITNNSFQTWISTDYSSEINLLKNRISNLEDGQVDPSAYEQVYYPRNGNASMTGWCEVQSNLYIPADPENPSIIILDDAGTSSATTRRIYGTTYNNEKAVALKAVGASVFITESYLRSNRSLRLRHEGSVSNRLLEDSYGPHIVLDCRAGVYSLDVNGFQYPMIYQNKPNLWIGAVQQDNYHHYGKLYLSAGYTREDTEGLDPTNPVGAWVPNDTIYIAVPDYETPTEENGLIETKFDGAPNTAKIYSALHSGNFIEWVNNLSSSKKAQLRAALGIS